MCFWLGVTRILRKENFDIALDFTNYLDSDIAAI